MKPVLWHILFHPKEEHHWWAKKYAHVSLAGYCDETWFHLDLNRSETVIQPYFAHRDVEDFLYWCSKYTDVLRVPDMGKPTSHFMRSMTCVSFVKHTLGIRSRALFPDQLFTTLQRDFSAEWINESQGTSSAG